MVYGWIWIAIIVVAVVVEALTDQLISIWFVPAAIIATIMDYADAKLIWQILVFLLVSAAGIIVGKTFLCKIKPSKAAKTNIEAVIGEKCVVVERIDNFAGCGLCKVRGQLWSARSITDDECFDEGDILTVVAIEGVKLICKKN